MSAHSSIPPRIVDHELIRTIAAGAYGEVWLGQTIAGTMRAVKIVRRDQHSSEKTFEREFNGLCKFEPVSRSHPALVDILNLGMLPDGGGFFYVMELADNLNAGAPRESYKPRTLRSEVQARGALPASEVVAIGLSLSSGLERLHAHGLVHRDVKPSNILFIGGEAKLADAGLVAGFDDARSLVGTAGYIAPEGPGSARADIYALGKTLYEAAFGKDRQDFPALPIDIASRADHALLLELNAILLRACATDPKDRYESAAQIRAEMGRLQDGRSIRRDRKVRRMYGAALKFAVAMIVVGAVIFFADRFRNAPYEPKLSSNQESLDAYIMARHLYEKNTGPDLTEAIKYFKIAIEKDPNFAQAYAGLASTYTWGGLDGFQTDYAKGSEFAKKALQLDPKLGEPHKVMGYLESHAGNKTLGDKEHRLAIKRSPNDAEAYSWYAVTLMDSGRVSEAIRQLEIAQRLAPSILSITALLGDAYMHADQYDRAIKQFERVVSMETNAPSYVFRDLAELYEAKGKLEQSLDIREQRERLQSSDFTVVKQKYDELRALVKTGGPEAYWNRQIWDLVATKADPYLIARCYIRLKDNQNALQWLKRCQDARAMNLWPKDPALDQVRDDRQFREELKRLGAL